MTKVMKLLYVVVLETLVPGYVSQPGITGGRRSQPAVEQQDPQQGGGSAGGSACMQQIPLTLGIVMRCTRSLTKSPKALTSMASQNHCPEPWYTNAAPGMRQGGRVATSDATAVATATWQGQPPLENGPLTHQSRTVWLVFCTGYCAHTHLHGRCSGRVGR